MLTRLNYEIPPVVSGSIIDFAGSYAALSGVSTQGDMLAGTGTVSLSYAVRQAEFSVDTRTFQEIRVLEVNDTFLGLCRGLNLVTLSL